MRFGYFLSLTYEPKYLTYTWTLDYQYNSDFGDDIFYFYFLTPFMYNICEIPPPPLLDDTVGHWQVMDHPTKA